MSKPKKEKETEQVDDAEIFVLQEKLNQAERASVENLNLAKYVQAEFENYKKRKREAISDALTEGRMSVIMEILPLLDSLYEGIKTITNKDDKTGLEIIVRKFNSVLGTFGVKEFKSLGKPFDVNLHNAIAVEEVVGKEPDIVVEEWAKGYKMNGKVLRVATVKISK